jgi:hypothetical protein
MREQTPIIVGDRFEAKLVCDEPGDVKFVLTIDGELQGTAPFDNVVKAATRIDPEHASVAEKQIKALRAEVGHLRGQLVDEQVLRTKVNQLERAMEMAKHDQSVALSELAQVRGAIRPQPDFAPEGMQTIFVNLWTSQALVLSDAAQEEDMEFGAFVQRIIRNWINGRDKPTEP